MHTAKPDIVPFWDRLPKFFVFPLLPGNLFVLGGLALGSLLAFVLPVMAPFNLLLAEAIVWITALRHAFRVMDLTSQGRITLAEQQAAFEHDPDRVNLPWKMIALFAIWGAAIGLLESINASLGWLAQAFVTLATPAIIMQLSASNEHGRSLNPGTWISYMRAIGKPYLALCFFLFLLVMGTPIALELLLPIIGPKTLLPAANFVCLYFNLIMFYMMGYVMYQHHDVLDLPVVYLAETGSRATGAADAQEPGVDAMIAARLAAGEADEAVLIARNAARDEPNSVAAQERLYTLLRSTGDASRANQQGQRLFALCLAQGQAARAVTLYQALRQGPDAIQLGADQILPLAKLASQQRDYQLALELVRGFDKRFPGHADIPGVYYFSAQLVSEQFRQNDMASRILESMLARFPDHALAGEARHYLEVLQRMAAISVGSKPA